MTGQLEHWRWSFYSWRPSGLALGLALRIWYRCKPAVQQWRTRRANKKSAALVQPVAITPEGGHASPSHSQR
jgi:hypothetical protein